MKRREDDRRVAEVINEASTEASSSDVVESVGTDSDGIGSEGDFHGLAEAQGSDASCIVEVASGSAREEVEPAPRRACFEGKWLVHRLEGDFDTFLTEMGQGWMLRQAAKAIRYGIGRVEVTCRQPSENEFFFDKVLADPLKPTANIHLVVGASTLHFRDDIGALTSEVQLWESNEVLRFEAHTDAGGLPITLRMYFNDDGDFVEEMVSWKGTTVKYIFAAQHRV